MKQARGYTLLEVLVIVVVLGIAASMVVPSLGTTGVLKVQAAVRTVISDITFAQSDALAYQSRRAIVYSVEENSYVLTEVNGSTIDPEADALWVSTGSSGRYEVDLDDHDWGGAAIESASFDGNATLVFDELGGPVAGPDSDAPSAGGQIVMTSSDSTFHINIEAFTGRVTVENVTDDEP